VTSVIAGFTWKSKADITAKYVKHPQLRTSAFYPLHPQISSAKFLHSLPIATSAFPHIRILPLATTEDASICQFYPMLRKVHLLT